MAIEAAASTELARRALRAIVIGGSAGGIDALRVLLPSIRRTCGVPLLVVLHVGAETVGGRWPLVFAGCETPIREAEDKDEAEPGTVHIAPPGYHLLVDESGVLSLSADAPVHSSRPSIDALFETAAWAYGEQLLGIVLSGANSDGAAGLAAISRAGGCCWVQDPREALATLMPNAAIQAVADARVLTAAAMAEILHGLGG